MSLSPEAAGAIIADVTRRLEKLQAATYQGRDTEGIATAIVDGHGLVVEVKLANTVARYRPVMVGEAIRAAIDAAQLQMAQAYSSLAEQAEKWRREEE